MSSEPHGITGAWTHRRGAWAAACLAGCGRRAPPASSAPAPLARVGAAVITEADVERELRRRAVAGRTAADAQAVLGEMIERQAMLQEAARAAWLQEPELRRERDNLLLAQWSERTLQEEKRRATVTEEDLRRAYQASPEAHATPPMARLAILYRKPSAPADSAAGEAPDEALRRARQTYLVDPAAATRNGRIPGFGALAAEVSEDVASRYRGGDLGWLDASRRDYRWPAEVVAVGFALPTGGVSEVLQTGQGLYVVMKQDARAGRVTPFEEAAPGLRRRLLRAKQEAAEAAFRSNLLARAGVVVNRERAVRLRAPAAIVPPAPPGLLPVAGLTNSPPAGREGRARSP